MCGSARRPLAAAIQIHADVEMAAYEAELGQVSHVIVGQLRGHTGFAAFTTLAALSAFTAFATLPTLTAFGALAAFATFVTVLSQLDGRRGAGSRFGGLVEQAGVEHGRRQRQRCAGQHHSTEPGPHLDPGAGLGDRGVSAVIWLCHRWVLVAAGSIRPVLRGLAGHGRQSSRRRLVTEAGADVKMAGRILNLNCSRSESSDRESF
jgi:hypothetical protein